MKRAIFHINIKKRKKYQNSHAIIRRLGIHTTAPKSVKIISNSMECVKENDVYSMHFS